MRDVIIIPTYNERENIVRLVPILFNLYPSIYILVIDDNSPDGTASAVRELMRSYPRLALRVRSGKFGLGSAYIEAMRDVLRTNDVWAVVTMDADFSHDPKTIAVMLRALESHDIVIGSRYVVGGSVVAWNFWRRMLSRWGNRYARTVIRVPVRDMTTGFHCFRGELLRRYDFDAISSTGFAFLMEMKIGAHILGARITEIPITFAGRTHGVSKLSNRIIYEGLIVPWKLRFQKFVWRANLRKRRRS
ncbi:MAG: polyprenol monophosphomannose synthase [bacterium]|nr:polyprenol monophosphomannose synthase [bacterium]